MPRSVDRHGSLTVPALVWQCASPTALVPGSARRPFVVRSRSCTSTTVNVVGNVFLSLGHVVCRPGSPQSGHLRRRSRRLLRPGPVSGAVSRSQSRLAAEFLSLVFPCAVCSFASVPFGSWSLTLVALNPSCQLTCIQFGACIPSVFSSHSGQTRSDSFCVAVQAGLRLHLDVPRARRVLLPTGAPFLAVGSVSVLQFMWHAS